VGQTCCPNPGGAADCGASGNTCGPDGKCH
jgi:hypothetical protein